MTVTLELPKIKINYNNIKATLAQLQGRPSPVDQALKTLSENVKVAMDESLESAHAHSLATAELLVGRINTLALDTAVKLLEVTTSIESIAVHDYNAIHAFNTTLGNSSVIEDIHTKPFI